MKRNQKRDKSETNKETERKVNDEKENEVKVGNQKRSENGDNLSQTKKETQKCNNPTPETCTNQCDEDEFSAPDESMRSWFERNWSSNIYYNLTREFTSLRYKASTKPYERKDDHRPMTNIGYKQYTTLQEIQESPVNLDIGGQIFPTSRITLQADPDSLLAILFRRSCPMRPIAGNGYRFDRNPVYFSYILDYLRNGGHLVLMILPGEKSALLALLTESRFFCLKGLEEIILDRLELEFKSRIF